MTYPWIAGSGETDTAGLEQLMSAFGESALTLAGWPDRWQGTRGPVSAARLLELRMISGSRELWAHRSAIGRPFSWRIADDAALREAVGEGRQSEYRFEQVQKLDIDTKNSPGNGTWRTTGGRLYTLPVTDENAVRLAVYVAYDGRGMARVADFRVMGFEKNDRFGRREA